MMNTQTFYSLPSISNSNENAHQQLSNTRFLRNDKIKYSFLWLIFILLTLLWGLTGTLHAQNTPPEAGGLDSLLLLAAKANNLPEVQKLVAQGANVNYQDEAKATILMWATYKADLGMVRYLCDKGAKHEIKGTIVDDNSDITYGSALAIAAGEAKTDILNYYLDEKKISIEDRKTDGRGGEGWNVLQYAIYTNQKEMVLALLAKGADINSKDEKGNPNLFFAFQYNKYEIAKILIDKGANVPAKDNYGNTPLHLVKDVAIAKILIEKGADIQAKDNNGNTPLHRALSSKLPEITQLLIEKGADMQAKNKDDNTPLHLVKDVAIAKILIEKGADIQAKDNNGNTPLHRALSSKLPEIAKILIDKGADIQAKDNQGNTTLHSAVVGNQIPAAKILLQKGLKADTENLAGKTSIRLAQEAKSEVMYALLLGEKSYQTYLRTAPLWEAIRQGDRPKAKTALQSGADTTYQNYAGQNTTAFLQDYRHATWQDFLNNKPFYLAEPTVQIGHAGSITQILLLPDNKSFLTTAEKDNIIKYWDMTTGKEIRTFVGHTGSITQILLLPDKTSFLSASWDKTVKHWDLASGKEIRTFEGHTRPVDQIHLLADNKSFLSASEDGTVKHWDIATGKEIHTFDGHTSFINQIYLLADNKSFLICCSAESDDKTVKHWDITTSKEIHTFVGHIGSVNQILLLPDKTSFLTASRDGTVKHWNLASGKEIRTFAGHTSGVSQILLLPDNKSFLTASDDNTIKHWDITTSKEIHTFVGHIGSVNQILLLPDKTSFLSASNDKTVKHWDIATGKKIHTFAGHIDRVNKILLLPDNKSFLSASDDGTVKHWDLASGKEIHTFTGHTSSISQILLLPDNKSFLTASYDRTIRHWDLASGKEIRTFAGHTDYIYQILPLPDNQSFLTASGDKTVKHWDLASGKEIRTFAGHTSSINQILLLADKQSFLSASGYGGDNTLKHWDIATSKEIRTFAGHTSSVTQILLLPDNKSFLTASWDKTVKHWDLASGKEIRTFAGHTERITQILLLPDNQSFLTASDDGTVKHWDITTGEEIHTFANSYSITLLPDNKTFLTASFDIIKHWDLSTDEEIQTFAGHTSTISQILLLPDNKSFLTRGDDKTVKHWDLASGKEIRTFAGHTSSISKILLLPDSKSFLTASNDNTVKHWDLATGKEIHNFAGHTSWVWLILILSDDKSFLSASRDGTVKHWDLTIGRELGTFRSRYGSVYGIHFLLDSTRFITRNLQNSLTLWDLKTYQEIATLIPVAGDNQDYVVISPDGRFDGTPAGMDKLIHFVAGTEIIELSQLKERFYTPDLWKTLLTAPEKLSSVESLNRIELYPEFDLEGKGNQLSIKLRPRNGGIGKVNVYINGREVNESKTTSPDFNPQRKTEIKIPLKDYQSYFSEGKNIISVKAYHAEGWLASRFQHISYQKGKLQSRSTDTTARVKPMQEGLNEGEIVDLDFDPSEFQGKDVGDFYALCIGTSDYSGESIKDLTFPTSDAQSMAEAFQIGAKKFFVDEKEPNKNKIFVRILTTDDKNPLNQPSKDNIRKAFQEIASKAKAEDVFVVFFAGHGTTFKKDDERFELFYYLTKDASSGDLVQDAIRQTRAISSDELIAWLKEIKANKQVMILDACHSGQAVDNIFAQRDIPASQKRALELMKDRTGLYIISGSAADAVSYESSEYGQGFLTYSLLLGMTGAALEKESNLLNVGTWFKYAANEVSRMASEYSSKQEPQVAEPKQNFWIGKFEEKDRNLIPLKEAKPMFGPATFLNQAQNRDNLKLSDLVKSELLEGTASQSLQGRSADYIYTDSDNKKVHLMGGFYTLDSQGNIKVSFSIYKGDTLVAEIKDLEGNTKEIKKLAEKIVSEAKKRVVK